MTRVTTVLVLALLVATRLPAQADPCSNVVRDPCPAEQRAVAQTLRAVLDAAENNELDKLDSFHLYGAKFSKFDGSGPRLDAATAQADEHRDIAAMRGFRAQADDLKVDVFGTTAVATFIMNYSAGADSGKVTGRARATMVFVKDGKRWKIAHEHFSPLPSGR